MKHTLVLLLLLGSCVLGFAQNDGPYLNYEHGKGVLRSVANGKVVVKRSGKKFWVSFPDRPDWNFRVHLKERITVEPSLFLEPEKIFAISDIEGEFAPFRALLIANGVMDATYHWTFGKGHLVVCGDLFDRGENVPEYLWLLYSLEAKALEAGGYVHVVLGNHDIMNLSGDLRYVKPKYLETSKLLGLDYLGLYDKSSALGRWLRSKNIVEKIGDQLFMHAGLSPRVTALAMSIAMLNATCRPYYDVKIGSMPDSIKVLFGDSAPFWYRGYFMEPKISDNDLKLILWLYQVKRVIVGHTIMEGNISFYFGGKVLAIDVDQHEGNHQAALYEQGKWYKVDIVGKRAAL